MNSSRCLATCHLRMQRHGLCEGLNDCSNDVVVAVLVKLRIMPELEEKLHVPACRVIDERKST